MMSVKTMRGNACYNFLASKDEIKNWIDTYQLNPDFEKDRILAIVGDQETVVYPEFYKGNHAVISRILNDQNKGVAL